MKTKHSWLFDWSHKRRFLEEVVAAEGGSGGGSGGEGAAAGGGAPAGVIGDAAGAGAGSGGAAAAGMSDADKQELTRLRSFHQAASQHVDFDEGSGVARPKAPPAAIKPPTAEEVARSITVDEAALRAVQLTDQARKAEESITTKFKGVDPLFDKNMSAAKEKVARLHPMQRTPEVMERAYNLARGENAAEYEKHYTKVGKEQALREMAKVNGVNLPASSGGAGGGETKPDLSKISLSPEQYRTANAMVAAGMLKNIDEYKLNMIELNQVEG